MGGESSPAFAHLRSTLPRTPHQPLSTSPERARRPTYVDPEAQAPCGRGPSATTVQSSVGLSAFVRAGRVARGGCRRLETAPAVVNGTATPAASSPIQDARAHVGHESATPTDEQESPGGQGHSTGRRATGRRPPTPDEVNLLVTPPPPGAALQGETAGSFSRGQTGAREWAGTGMNPGARGGTVAPLPLPTPTGLSLASVPPVNPRARSSTGPTTSPAPRPWGTEGRSRWSGRGSARWVGPEGPEQPVLPRAAIRGGPSSWGLRRDNRPPPPGHEPSNGAIAPGDRAGSPLGHAQFALRGKFARGPMPEALMLGRFRRWRGRFQQAPAGATTPRSTPPPCPTRGAEFAPSPPAQGRRRPGGPIEEGPRAGSTRRGGPPPTPRKSVRRGPSPASPRRLRARDPSSSTCNPRPRGPLALGPGPSTIPAGVGTPQGAVSPR